MRITLTSIPTRRLSTLGISPWSLSDVWENTRKLFEFLREVHGGPLFGEGSNHYYWAGAIDGAEAQVQGGEHASWLVDFDLLKLHPQMVNHGMGYHERWLESGYGPNWGSYIPPQYKLDKYRAMELAFGHAGFIANQIWQVADVAPILALQEYFLMAPVQVRYAMANPTSILYEVDSKFLDISSVIRAGVSPERVAIQYDSGLRLWVNGSEKDWRVEGIILPPYGFLAKAPGLLAYTARDSQGIINDMALADGQLYVNSRTAGYLPPWDSDYKRHLNTEGKPVDFGAVITDGSLVIEADSTGIGDDGRESLVIRPIPRTREFEVKLRVKELLAALGTARASEPEPERIAAEGLRLRGFDVDGKAILDVPFELNAGILSFQHTSAEVAYYRLDISNGR